MGQSYRIRTELGINKTINIQLDQEFEFLEILSLKLQQEDVYVKSCAEYGVIVGRVTANNGFGLPNARVSVFIPIDSVDESNPIISSIYPYKSPNDRNEDGYRYNLLPYEQSYSTHAATGTLPSRLDSLTGSTAIEIYDKYYKFSVKTNESGDYMIMGVPQGQQTLVMDVDLSDIGEFSLTPQDLIRMGLATDAQVAGNRFRTSTDLNSLPQIVNIVKSLEVSPLWGDPELCSIAINRLDFDLRDNANINIEPTSIFMGSIYSTADSFRVRPNGRPRDNMGNLCSLSTGPGQILAIRQTIYQDSDGNPTLEQYQLEQAGNIIDGNGTWLTELPMNLDYYITNEFGDKVISNDPTIGIPTKAKYRFKIKWEQPPSLTEQVRRPYYLVPNIKEYGWFNTNLDPSPTEYTTLSDDQKKQQSSYYFGLAWSGYTDGFTNPTQKLNRLNEIIDCDDTFYEFQFNRVYTVSGLIDEYKKGGRGRFIGIKEIDSQDCDSTVNKFPVNDGFRNFDLLYFVFAILFQVIQVLGIPIILVYHITAFIWTYVLPVLLGGLITLATVLFVQDGIAAGAALISIPPNFVLAGTFFIKFLAELAIATLLAIILRAILKNKIPTISLPMITYPDCQACECNTSTQAAGGADVPIPSPGLLSQLSNSALYYNSIYENYLVSEPEDVAQANGAMISQSIGGSTNSPRNPQIYKSTQSAKYNVKGLNFYTLGTTLPPGERINVYNTRKKFFDGVNKIKTTFNYPSNGSRYHFDNTLTVLATQDVEVGTLLSFVNPSKSTDKNYLWSGLTTVGGVQVNGINGIIKNNAFTATVRYATSQKSDTFTTYDIPSGNSQCFLSVTLDIDTIGSIVFSDCSGVSHFSAATTTGLYTISSEYGVDISTITGVATWTGITYGQATQRYIYPSDIEYYQVLTAITITSNVVGGKTYYTIPNLGPNTTSFWSALTADNNFYLFQEKTFDKGNWYFSYGGAISELPPSSPSTYPTSYFENFVEQKVLILQRGVDPYSPLLPNRYGIGKILGHSSEDAVVITGMTRMNIPIQSLPSSATTSVQQHNYQENIYSSSYFYTPGIPSSPLFPTASSTPGLAFSSYTTSNVGYYGALDSKFVATPYLVKSNGKTYGGSLTAGITVHSAYVSYMPNIASISGVFGVNTKSQNKFYSVTLNPQNYYDNSEDLSGGAYMFGNLFNNGSPYGRLPVQKRSDGYFLEPDTPFNLYYSPILYPYMTGTTQLNITNSSKNIMRTDRLPSSDYIDNDFNLNGSVSLLQQNLGFAVYSVDGTLSSNSPSFSTGAQQPTADIAGQLASENVLTTLNTCENMVGLTCYSGNGTNFGVEAGCNSNDAVESGCYVMVRRILVDLFKDWKSFAEWGYRFRFFYGLCRGVLSQSFVNNWVNGSLYTFPIQVNTFFNTNNEPTYPNFPRQIVYYNGDSNNFYYRSSPYLLTTSSTTTKFIGSPTNKADSPTNNRNLLYPTTIFNLGIKDDFYQEIIFDASAKGYVMKSLQPTSYSDTSDLVNLFVISRISDSSFLKQILSGLNASLNKLFSRPHLRIDGDLAQSMSINSEYGVIPFSPEFYAVNGTPNDPVVIITSSSGPTMGIFFSSTTVDLQNKDFLTPGIIDFRPSNNANAITYEYGIKSQTTPFYQWGLKQPSTQSIFGSDLNNWLTDQTPTNSGIVKYKYQSLSRRNVGIPSYFVGANTAISDIYQRGYIYSVNSSGGYSANVSGIQTPEKFLVSAPFHFYFGLIKGETALDKFKIKYSVGE